MKNKNITKKLIPVLMAFTLILTGFTAKAETESSPNSVDVTVPGTQIIETISVSSPYTLKPGKQPETFAVYDADGKQIGIGAAYCAPDIDIDTDSDDGDGSIRDREKYVFLSLWVNSILVRFNFNGATIREKDELINTIREDLNMRVSNVRTTKSKGWTYGPYPSHVWYW